MRLLGYASPDGKRGAARGNTDKNVGRVAPGQPLQPVEPSRRRILVFHRVYLESAHDQACFFRDTKTQL